VSTGDLVEILELWRSALRELDATANGSLNERPQKRGLSSGGWSIERRRSGWTPVWTMSRRLSRRHGYA